MSASREGHSALVVCKDDQLRFLIEVVLQKEGYTVTATGSVKAALDANTKILPQVVIADVKLDAADGIPFIENVRRANPDCRCIGMTGDTVPRHLEDAKTVGYARVLVKPFGLQELIDATKLESGGPG
jgi:DNA-binding NtrC family response regulator